MRELLPLIVTAGALGALGTALVVLGARLSRAHTGPVPEAERPDWGPVLTGHAEDLERQARTERDHNRRHAMRLMAKGLRLEAADGRLDEPLPQVLGTARVTDG